MRSFFFYPILRASTSNLQDSATPNSINYAYNFGSLLGIVMTFMVIFGTLLTIHYIDTSYIAFGSVEHIMTDVQLKSNILYIGFIYAGVSRNVNSGSYRQPRSLDHKLLNSKKYMSTDNNSRLPKTRENPYNKDPNKKDPNFLFRYGIILLMSFYIVFLWIYRFPSPFLTYFYNLRWFAIIVLSCTVVTIFLNTITKDKYVHYLTLEDFLPQDYNKKLPELEWLKFIRVTFWSVIIYWTYLNYNNISNVYLTMIIIILISSIFVINRSFVLTFYYSRYFVQIPFNLPYTLFLIYHSFLYLTFSLLGMISTNLMLYWYLYNTVGTHGIFENIVLFTSFFWQFSTMFFALIQLLTTFYNCIFKIKNSGSYYIRTNPNKIYKVSSNLDKRNFSTVAYKNPSKSKSKVKYNRQFGGGIRRVGRRISENIANSFNNARTTIRPVYNNTVNRLNTVTNTFGRVFNRTRINTMQFGQRYVRDVRLEFLGQIRDRTTGVVWGDSIRALIRLLRGQGTVNELSEALARNSVGTLLAILGLTGYTIIEVQQSSLYIISLFPDRYLDYFTVEHSDAIIGTDETHALLDRYTRRDEYIHIITNGRTDIPERNTHPYINASWVLRSLETGFTADAESRIPDALVLRARAYTENEILSLHNVRHVRDNNDTIRYLIGNINWDRVPSLTENELNDFLESYHRGWRTTVGLNRVADYYTLTNLQEQLQTRLNSLLVLYPGPRADPNILTDNSRMREWLLQNQAEPYVTRSELDALPTPVRQQLQQTVQVRFYLAQGTTIPSTQSQTVNVHSPVPSTSKKTM